ncbi:MAG: teneurin-3 [Acetatifactor sp.]|nr:teneurin-3 [Acetatifactor sp.]
MSNRTKESNKAIDEAWKKEKKRVSEGKGTRDWTPEQQHDILDKGKAYDENGKPFCGHHMRSVSIYPEEQGNPDNIQFLSPEEHKEAHIICWQPTNWYYDPITKERIEFGTGPIIPCKEIKLSEPVISSELLGDSDLVKRDIISKEKEIRRAGPDSLKTDSVSDEKYAGQQAAHEHKDDKIEESGRIFNKIVRRLSEFSEFAKNYFKDHKQEMITSIVEGAVNGAINGVTNGLYSSIGNSHDGAKSQNDGSHSQAQSAKSIENVQTTDKKYPETHASPREHTVSGSKQRYHTKEGIIWKEKDPYPRGGKHPK